MIAIVILAAGESRRMGRAKQNLLFRGQTLLESTIEAAQRSKGDTIYVVLGAHAAGITPIPETITLYNSGWKEGMASSIRMALVKINADPAITSVIILLCDQPYVSAVLINALIDRQTETGKHIVACAYKNTVGVPALFDRSLFSALLQLQGKDGAKKILKSHAADVAIIPFEKGSIDIDTPEDYKKLC